MRTSPLPIPLFSLFMILSSLPLHTVLAQVSAAGGSGGGVAAQRTTAEGRAIDRTTGMWTAREMNAGDLSAGDVPVWSTARTDLRGVEWTGHGFAEPLLRLGLLGLKQTRQRMSLRHLQADSCGLEIRVLHYPLEPLPGARANYVDRHSMQLLYQLFADAGASIVAPDLLADRFSLGCIADASQDLLIANHVLEHRGDALSTLQHWLRVLPPGGMIFVAVLIAERCFNHGRAVTPTEHFLDDCRLTAAGDAVTTREPNRAH